ncbi:MAG: hypothetical protein GY953_32235, partial [bacterium]|nr:hypothetical protein [bacterium]
MMSEGYSGRVLPYVSCWGNIDFMSMLTGAPVGTQYRSSGEHSRHRGCASEALWHVLAGEGRRSLLVSFPGAVTENNVAVIPNPTLQRGAIYQAREVHIEGLFSGKLETTGWPPGGGPKPGRRPELVEVVNGEVTLGRWPARISGDNLVVYQGKNGEELARSRLGSWSSWGKTSVKDREGRVRFRLLETDPLQVVQSAVCAVDGFSQPPELAGQLVEKLGPGWIGSAIPPMPLDPYWQVGEAEAAEGFQWVADAALAAIDLWDWEFFLHKVSLLDTALHQCLTLADPSYHLYDEEIGQKADAAYKQAFVDFDAVIGRLLKALEERGDTTLVIASDHGGGVNNVVCDIDKRLEETGLKEHAYTKRKRQGTEIYVKAASPAEYEKTQEAVIDALLDWRSPLDGKRVVTYALKRRDAALIGYWGKEAGDVQFCYNPGFVWGVNPDGAAIAPSRSPVSNHGPQVVTGETGYSSMMGYLTAWGPGVAPGVRRDEAAAGPVPIGAVAPTIAKLLECRPPRDCQFGTIRELLR